MHMPLDISFHRFGDLPLELRTHIWKLALPGPRIVQLQRHLKSGESVQDFQKTYGRTGPGPIQPEPTHFVSPSPKGSILSLAHACQESYSIVAKRYSLIAPSTWFCFAIDFLYLDWGCRDLTTVSFQPQNFASTFPNDLGMFRKPEFDQSFLAQVRNIVVHGSGHANRAMLEEQWLVNNLLRLFTGVQKLVLADKFYDTYENGEELVWLKRKLGAERGWAARAEKSEGKTPKRKDRISPLSPRKLFLWDDPWRYRTCVKRIDRQRFERLWLQHAATKDRPVPKVSWRCMATANVRKRFLGICGSEDRFSKLEKLTWEWVIDGEYVGDLTLSQQIAYLELVLGRLLSQYEILLQGDGDVRREPSRNIAPVISRLDALVAEREMMEVITSEAEEMVWE